MKSRKKDTTQGSLFFSLGDTLNPQHPLYRLADKIDWQCFEDGFDSLYCADNGRPAKPIRLMCGLLILKHVRDLSDESVVEQWSENSYYQDLCQLLNVSKRTLQRYRSAGELTYITIHHKIFYTEKNVEKFIRDHFAA